MSHARCQACGCLLRWGLTRDGARMPLELDPHPAGNVYVYPQSGVLRVLTSEERERAVRAGVTLFRSHHASPCGGRHRVPRAQLGFEGVDG